MLRELRADVIYRLRAVFRRSRMEDDLDTELRFHLDREAEELERRGMTHEAARRQARLAFGGVELMKEETRDARGTAFVETLLQDVRYAFRVLRKEPSFTLTIVLLLGLGIGANTATFTVMQALLFRTLPVPDPEQLVIVGRPSAIGSGWHGAPQTDEVSFPLYKDVLSRNRALSDIYAAGRVDGAEVGVVGSPTQNADVAEHTEVRLVTANYFDILRVPAARGRTFTARVDQSEESAPVAVISDGYWLRRFARDPTAIGRTITINRVPVSVVGVMPQGFGDVVGSATDMWVPMGMQPALMPYRKLLDDRSWSWLQMMGRLAPGVTLPQARAALAAIEADAIRVQLSGKDRAEFESDLREDPVEVGSGARGFSRFRRDYKPALIVVMCAVGLIILVVCANIANLLLVRAVSHTREMTVRMALGAGRRRLLRQLLTETLLLAAAGGALGLWSSKTGSDLLVGLANAPISLDTRANQYVLVFAAGLTLLCAILFGLVPALKGTRVDLATALRAQGRTLIGTRTRLGRFAAGRTLVVVQIALSTMLLIGAGLLVRSMQRIVKADLGFDRGQLVMVHVSTQRAGYANARASALVAALLDRVRTLPGVLDASATLHGLFSGGYGTMSFVPPGAGASAVPQEVKSDAVGRGYFHAIGAQLLRGREFDTRDSGSGGKNVILSESLARSFFGAADPLGRPLRDDAGATYTVVGVVRDLHEASVRDRGVEEAYIPISEGPIQYGFWIAARVHGDPDASVAAVRRAVLDVDPSLPLEVRPFNDLVGESISEDRLTMRVTAFFGLVALLLAALGLYGVTSYATSQRRGEFGLRIALGAEPAGIARMVLMEAVALGAIGVGCGVPVGLLATRVIRDQMFGVGRIDPLSLTGALAVLIMTTIAAAYLPARRAARIAPLQALQTE